MAENDTLKDALNCEFDNIGNIDSILCVLGLSFPDSATPFQKAFLTLAHLMASCRDYVLKGFDVPDYIATSVKLLADIVYSGKEQQR